MNTKFFQKSDGGFMLNEVHTSEPFKVFDDPKVPDIHVFKNVSIPHDKKQMLRCSDPVFIMNLTSQYIHFLVDAIGAYLYIKQFVDKLELKVFVKTVGGMTTAMKEVLDLISKKNNVQIINIKDNAYIYDQVYDFANGSIFRKEPPSNSTNELFPPVRENFLKYANGKTTYEKIFISRAETPRTGRTIENEGHLDDFFKEMGYKVLYLETLSFLDQMYYFANARYVAGIMGTGLTNTIFCKPGTRVISINTDCEYFWSGWSRISDEFGLYYTELSFNNCIPTSAERLINRLKELNGSIF
jgi:hypothetical protein